MQVGIGGSATSNSFFLYNHRTTCCCRQRYKLAGLGFDWIGKRARTLPLSLPRVTHGANWQGGNRWVRASSRIEPPRVRVVFIPSGGDGNGAHQSFAAFTPPSFTLASTAPNPTNFLVASLPLRSSTPPPPTRGSKP
jgi:hypothetical protein